MQLVWAKLWAKLTSGEGRGLEIEFSHSANDLINHASIMKPQQNLWAPCSVEHPSGEPIDVLEGWW